MRIGWFVTGLLLGALISAMMVEVGATAWWLLFPFFVTFELMRHVPAKGRRAEFLVGALLASVLLVIPPLRAALIESTPYRAATATLTGGTRSTSPPSAEALMARAEAQTIVAESLAREGRIEAAVDTLATAIVHASNAGDLDAVEEMLRRQIELHGP